MKSFPSKYNIKIFICLIISIILIIPLITIPIRLALASYKFPQPQAILTLGGGLDREKFTTKFAQSHPSLDIWVSSGIPPKQANEIFRAAGINPQRIHLDYRATDTVTNFTTLVQDFKHRKIHHLYLITSEFHMRRAKAIATVVLGSQEITFTPVAIPSNHPKETTLHVIRDTSRALTWVFTNRTGATLNPRLHVVKANMTASQTPSWHI
ncbi:MAG: YdcF family protein [Nostocales cyanobacterium 94392]|nr:YdcF family protein [Nostocales cyanobacterium 94392]